MMSRKGNSESKIVFKYLRDLVFYIDDVYLIDIILKFWYYSDSTKSKRDLSLKLGLIKYMLKLGPSNEYYKNGFGIMNECGRRIAYQV